MVIQLTILPTELNIIKGLLNSLIPSLIILPPDLIQIDRLLNNLLIVPQPQCYITGWAYLCGAPVCERAPTSPFIGGCARFLLASCWCPGCGGLPSVG